MSSPSTLSSSSLPSPTASIVEGVVSVNQLAWQAPVFFIVTLVIVAIIVGTIILIWNDHWVPSIRPRLIMTFVEFESPYLFFPASSLVGRMLRYFFTTPWPAFRTLRQAAATPSASLSSVTPRSLPAVLPRFRPPDLREPELAVPCPLMLRDRNPSSVGLNPYSTIESSGVPAARQLYTFPRSSSSSSTTP
ncbi:hypothetical protein F5148DRAFT_799795 [Russula earlei]|uniref:Uncharacterized protein n=1 Tax=Russula earlei TaxID=71964 RepID=A0ACC0TUC9_9AGAM|nr:hypothetical protein F5148DRAFT_799795 [Russula earlei]